MDRTIPLRPDSNGVPLRLTLPEERLLSALASSDLECHLWGMTSAPPLDHIDIAVVPYMSPPSTIAALTGVDVRLVQSQMSGYEGVAAHLPKGVVYCNAAGVHEASTAELAVGLMIAGQREFTTFQRQQDREDWDHRGTRSLADSRVLILGYGRLGKAIEARLTGFEVTAMVVAQTARTAGDTVIHGMDELPGLLASADIVVLALPLTERTRAIVDRDFLAAMRPQALLVNVGRGALVDTPALVEAIERGDARAALDVTDPEPLPSDHPLWSLPGVFITPHIGGHSDAMVPRIVALIKDQIQRMRAGGSPVNVVFDTRESTAALDH